MSDHMQDAAAPQAFIGMGQVWHRRLRPAEHQFSHDSYFLLLPMRHGRSHGWAVPRRRFGLITFLDQDHGEGGPDALAWFDSLLRQEGIDDADGEIWLQTYPRVLGHAFKPVSFWFAHRADGTLTAILAEVNNTFGERHCYLLQGEALHWGQTLTADKVFHVSPFCSVAGQYRFRFERTAERTLARIDLHDEQGPLLQTSISGHLHPFTARSARHAFCTMPLMTLGVVARIHWHALKLLLKRVPFFHKPAAPERFVTR
ncbi:DUF1365 domain-containing protein [Aquabacterium sp.]|uniref:DUF1365 domain-containing protein n=1 Tax=Aquabacterium sp. TaxID=1872578 RepID=UPI0025B91915|nr:DUF1365 domain-containing protein [Aquabacterium sp.]